jgi:DNA-binding CsgD family transcriptional regulator
MATTAMGRHADADVYLDIPVPDAMFRTPCGLHYLEARGLHHLAVDRLHAALSDFQMCGSLMSSWGLDLPTLVPWRTHTAATEFRLGRRRDAHRLVREQMSMLGEGNTRTVGASLRVLAEVGEPERRPALLREAVTALREAGDRLELAQAFAALGGALRACGRSGEAEEARRAALDLAKEIGAEPLERLLTADETPAESLPGGRNGAEAAAVLSRSERRVAALAAEGHTNRQIARKLYITVSTVEQHLTNAYRKLDVSRRSDLPRGLC